MRYLNLSNFKTWIGLYVFYLTYILIIQNFIFPNIPSIHYANGVLKGDNQLFYSWALDMAHNLKLHGINSWQLFPDNAAGLNVSLSSIFFSIFGDHISVLAPFNSLIHLITAFILHSFLKEIGFHSKSTIFGVLCFLFFQLH